MKASQWRGRGAIRLHVTLVGGLTLCAVGSWVEWHRALEGRAIAWVYAFEWPLFAVLGTWIWWRLLHENTPSRRVRRTRARPGPAIPEDDPGLVAWRAYLSEIEGVGEPQDGPARSPGTPGERPRGQPENGG